LKERSVDVYGLDGKPSGSIQLPAVFATDFRPDLIRRAVVAIQSHRFQPKGRNPMAGKRTSAESFGVGRDLARVPRVKGEQYSRAGSAAFVPSAVGGRQTHPPTPERVLEKKINKKERQRALASAVAATGVKEIVAARGHIVEGVPSFPLVVSDEIQSASSTESAKSILTSLGVWADIDRAKARTKVRSGKSKARGRAKRHGVGPLIVIKEDKGIVRAARNLVGVKVVQAKCLNVENLAPGTHPGRLTVWAESAVRQLDQLFGGGD